MIDEIEAAMLVAFRFGEIPTDWSMTRDASGSAKLWKLHTPKGTVYSATRHHWAAAGVQLAIWIGNLERIDAVAGYTWQVVQSIYPRKTFVLDRAANGEELAIKRFVRYSPGSGVPSYAPTPYNLLDATTTGGLVDPLAMYMSQHHGLEPFEAEEFLRRYSGGRGREKIALETGPLPPLRIETPDFDEFEKAIAEAERLTS